MFVSITFLCGGVQPPTHDSWSGTFHQRCWRCLFLIVKSFRQCDQTGNQVLWPLHSNRSLIFTALSARSACLFKAWEKDCWDNTQLIGAQDNQLMLIRKYTSVGLPPLLSRVFWWSAQFMNCSVLVTVGWSFGKVTIYVGDVASCGFNPWAFAGSFCTVSFA